MEYPVFAVGYIEEEGIILAAGGGGPTKSGIPNGLTAFQCNSETNSLKKVGFLTTGSKAAMSMVVHPREYSLIMGVGERCWLVNVDWDRHTGVDGKVMLGLTRAIKSEFSSDSLSNNEDEHGYQVRRETLINFLEMLFI